MVLKLIRYVWKVLECRARKRWIDFARIEVLHKAKEQGNKLHTIKRKEGKLDW